MATSQLTLNPALSIYLPAWNAASGAITYGEISTEILTDLANNNNTLFEQVGIYAAVNKANPDWSQLSNPTVQTISGVTGEFEVVSADTANPVISAIYVECTTVPPNIDQWYGSSSFGVYGVTRQGTPSGGAFEGRWLNSPISIIDYSEIQPSVVTVSLKPGVVANIYLFTALTYPIIYYATAAGLNTWLFPNSGATGNYNPG